MFKTPRDVIEKWMQAVNLGDVKDLICLYDKQAVLMPTFSNILLNTQEKLRSYFEKLGSLKGLSINLHVNTLQTQAMDNERFVISGIYT